MNGTGITLAPATAGFNVSSDNVVFDGSSASSSAIPSASGSSTSAPSASATAKSGVGKVQVGIASFIGVGCVALVLW